MILSPLGCPARHWRAAFTMVVAGAASLALGASPAFADNGCGPAGNTKVDPPPVFIGSLFINLPPIYVKTADLVPDQGPFFDFRAACKTHDDCYGTWGAKRLTCDLKLLSLGRRHCLDDEPNETAAACTALALLYYKAVRAKGSGAFQNGQIGAGLRRALSVTLLGKPDVASTTPFAKFLLRIGNGASKSLTCVLDGIPGACSPTPSYAVAKGTHTFVAKATNSKGTYAVKWSWTAS